MTISSKPLSPLCNDSVFMAKVTWNEFRSLHKGQARDEIKVLWAQYKEGQYEIETENNEVPDELTTEEEFAAKNKVAELVNEEHPTLLTGEEVEEVKEIDHRKEFLKLFNELYILNKTGEIPKSLHQQLMTHALATRPKQYQCGTGDGWTLYLGETNKALLVNETRQTAFAITRKYFHRFYQGAALIDTQLFSDDGGVERLKLRFKRLGKLVSRYPVPGVEIRVPSSKLDIPLPSGVM